MNLVLVPLTMKLLFLLPNLHLKHDAKKEKKADIHRERPLFDWKILSENGTASAQRKF